MGRKIERQTKNKKIERELRRSIGLSMGEREREQNKKDGWGINVSKAAAE